MKHCFGCKSDKSNSEFYRDKTRKDGFYAICKVCCKERLSTRYKERLHNWYKDKKGSQIICLICGNKTNSKADICFDCVQSESKISKFKTVIHSYKNHIKSCGCCVCGYSKYLGALDFHHLFKNKDKDIARIRNMSDLRFEIDNFPIVILCSNCHREVHAGFINEESLKQYIIKNKNHQNNLFKLHDYKN